MKTLNNVIRIKTPTAAEFRKRYVVPYKPVIFTDLFKDSPIHQMTTLGTLKKSLGDVKVLAKSEYNILESIEYDDWYYLGDFLDYVIKYNNAQSIVSEFNTPDEILEMFGEFPFYKMKFDDQSHLSQMFVSRKSYSIPFHFDPDHRHVIFHQVLGRKRISMITPQFGWKLYPAFHFSTLNIQNVAQDFRLEFLKDCHAYDVILNPGETLYMPPLIWHMVENIDPCMSVGFRFGRNRFNQFLQNEIFRDENYYALSVKFLNKRDSNKRYRLAFENIKRAHKRKYKNKYERYLKISKVYEKLASTLCPELTKKIDSIAVQEMKEQFVRRQTG